MCANKKWLRIISLTPFDVRKTYSGCTVYRIGITIATQHSRRVTGELYRDGGEIFTLNDKRNLDQVRHIICSDLFTCNLDVGTSGFTIT